MLQVKCDQNGLRSNFMSWLARALVKLQKQAKVTFSFRWISRALIGYFYSGITCSTHQMLQIGKALADLNLFRVMNCPHRECNISPTHAEIWMILKTWTRRPVIFAPISHIVIYSAQNTTRIRTIIPRSTESAKSDQHWISYVFHISLDQEVSKHASKQRKFYSLPKRYNKIARFEKKPYTSNQHET
jgi:hypothetical protein